MTATRKTYRLGTHRLVDPAATVARVRSLLPVLGITRIANVTGLDSLGIPVVMACRPNARSIAVSQGKGLTLDAARASAVMEAIEVAHAESILQPLKLAAFDELCYTHPLAAVDRLPFSADSLFHPDLPLLWIEGRDLIGDGPCWLPYELVHANYTLPFPPGSGCFLANTNGLSSGNHLLEATLHGICELIERDANTLWNLRGAEHQRATGVDPATITDPDCRDLLDRYAAAGLELRIWDTTADTGVATLLCQVWEGPAHPWRIWPFPTLGSGCHPSRAVALLRALTEAAQVRATFIAGSRDDLGPEEYPTHAPPQSDETLDIHRPVRRFQDIPDREADTFEDDLAWILERLQAVGIDQVIRIDLTRPAFRLPVTRIVIPGLEGPHDDLDYTPGARAAAVRQASV